MNPAPIDALVQALLAEFQEDPRGRRAAQRLSAYAEAHEDWKRFAHFKPDTYTRNLVARNEHFEMLVLCWSPGQASPIHDHAGQHCWMGILDGVVEETQFEFPAETGGPLRERATRSFSRGKVAYIHDDIGLHRVRPGPGSFGVSLHLYSKPIDTCRVFDPATGAVLEKTLLYHSVAGVLAAR
ncbi:MAG: cysteine dioxygenase family protein [Planctomycetes bacterium]|nr:cysteine dioxygenase family protein [Planctomycetota bacterium]